MQLVETPVRRRWKQRARFIILQPTDSAAKEFDAALAEEAAISQIHDRCRVFSSHAYSGLLSTTPAVQAEVMYGLWCRRFSFCICESGRVHNVGNECVAGIVKERRTQHLLKGGASYSNLYSALTPPVVVATASISQNIHDVDESAGKRIAVLPLFSWTLPQSGCVVELN